MSEFYGRKLNLVHNYQTHSTEMTMVAGQYDYSLTLLLMPDAEWQRPQHDDGEP